MAARLAALALLAGVLAAASGPAQDPPPAGGSASAPRPKIDRTVYPVKGGDPAALAEVVAKHFKGEVEVSAVAGALVLSGPAASVAEAAKLVGQIDRRPRTVELDITLVEASGAAADLPAGGLDRAKADELVKAGGSVRRIRLTAAEDQPVSTQTGSDKPMLTASTVGPKGAGPGGQPGFGGQRSIHYRPVGTTVKATSRAGGDGSVTVDLSVQDSSVRPPPAGDETGSPAFEQASLSTRLTVPAGKAVVAQAARKDGKDDRAVTMVVVTARVVGAEQ
ncbi:MAG: hypothetical protein K2X87_23725 [Gemmataceae bacterium]|nr:hypothetical protein [Gemmataceae bacterium]